MSWITVQVKCREMKQIQSIADEIQKIDGVESVEALGDDAEFVLLQIGKRLFQFENLDGLDCPFRDMREEIESLLKIDLRKAHIGKK